MVLTHHVQHPPTPRVSTPGEGHSVQLTQASGSETDAQKSCASSDRIPSDRFGAGDTGQSLQMGGGWGAGMAGMGGKTHFKLSESTGPGHKGRRRAVRMAAEARSM